MLTMSLIVARVMLAVLLALAAWQRTTPRDLPSGEQSAAQAGGGAAPAAPGAAPADITNADDLLRALETAGADIRRLTATVRYVKTFAIQGDTQQRDGRLVFASEPGADGEPSARRFGITFTELRLGLPPSQRLESADTGFLERYIFDGQWLAEVRPLEKQFVRRQVVAPGERWDPLRLGEGPFPVPIQQRREDILSRFDAELLAGAEGVDDRKLTAVAGGCYQLRLTPRADAGDQELREVRVWYLKDSLLPCLAKTINTADDESFVLLKDMLLNGEAVFGASELSTEPPAERAGWDITIEPYRE